MLAVAVAGNHVHFLAEMPADANKYRDIVGRAKTAACYSVRVKKSGRIWGRNATYKLIKDEDHQRNTFRYILAQKDAWVWSFKDEVDEEEKEVEEEEQPSDT